MREGGVIILHMSTEDFYTGYAVMPCSTPYVEIEYQ